MKKSILVAALLLATPVLLADDVVRKPYLVGTRVAAKRFKMPIQFRDVLPEQSVERFSIVEGFAAELTDQEVAILRADGNVRFVEPDPIRQARGGSAISPSQVRTAGQTRPYGIGMVNADKVWTVASGATVKVAILDTGIDVSHPDLIEHYRGGFDFVENDSVPQDGNGHGTHVAGTIGAVDNAFGVVGVAPNVEIYAARVLDNSGSGRSSNIIKAVDWAVQNGMNVLNLSLGSEQGSALEEQAFDRAANAGILVFAASGNCFTGCDDNPQGIKEAVDYPAAYASVISVGAIDEFSKVGSFSQRGTDLDIVAPGVAVLSSVPVGSSETTGVTFATGPDLPASLFTRSPRGELTAPYVSCGIGKPEEFPAQVAGKIALIGRGELTFSQKVKNAMAAGASAVVIYNNRAVGTDGGGVPNGILCDDYNDVTAVCSDAPFTYALTVGISKENGEALVAQSRGNMTISSKTDDYDEFQGTSMATPHAAGVAALIWSVARNATAAQIRDAIFATTSDLGSSGRDDVFGRGLIDALGAAKMLAPDRFNSSQPPATGKRTHGRR